MKGTEQQRCRFTSASETHRAVQWEKALLALGGYSKNELCSSLEGKFRRCLLIVSRASNTSRAAPSERFEVRILAVVFNNLNSSQRYRTRWVCRAGSLTQVHCWGTQMAYSHGGCPPTRGHMRALRSCRVSRVLIMEVLAMARTCCCGDRPRLRTSFSNRERAGH